jgi:hypothetical protein
MEYAWCYLSCRLGSWGFLIKYFLQLLKVKCPKTCDLYRPRVNKRRN